MTRFQRTLQALCLALFLLLLLAAGPLLTGTVDPARVFALDPAAYLGAALSGRILLPGLGALLFLLLLTWLLGRFFCGHVCPLGTTCDAVRPAVAGKPRAEPAGEGWTGAKYLVLLFIAATSLLGLNLAYWGAPLTLAGRLFILVLGPAGEFLLSGLSGAGLLSDRPASALGLPPDRYLGAWFFLLFFAALLMLQVFLPSGPLSGGLVLPSLFRRAPHAAGFPSQILVPLSLSGRSRLCPGGPAARTPPHGLRCLHRLRPVPQALSHGGHPQ